MGTTRLHGLIDGVFAIAMTLLVLDLPRPDLARVLAHDLEIHWDAYVAYLISFATLGIVWIEHHGMLSVVHRTNRRFQEITLAFLLFVALIPWPTALAATFADETSTAARLVAALYSASLFMVGATFALGWFYLARHPPLVDEAARPALHTAYRRSLLVTLPYLAAAIAALLSSTTAFVIDGVAVIYFAATRSEVAALVDKQAASGE